MHMLFLFLSMRRLERRLRPPCQSCERRWSRGGLASGAPVLATGFRGSRRGRSRELLVRGKTHGVVPAVMAKWPLAAPLRCLCGGLSGWSTRLLKTGFCFSSGLLPIPLVTPRLLLFPDFHRAIDALPLPAAGAASFVLSTKMGKERASHRVNCSCFSVRPRPG